MKRNPMDWFGWFDLLFILADAVLPTSIFTDGNLTTPSPISKHSIQNGFGSFFRHQPCPNCILPKNGWNQKAELGVSETLYLFHINCKINSLFQTWSSSTAQIKFAISSSSPKRDFKFSWTFPQKPSARMFCKPIEI